MKLHSVENERIHLVLTSDELGMLQASLNEARVVDPLDEVRESVGIDAFLKLLQQLAAASETVRRGPRDHA